MRFSWSLATGIALFATACVGEGIDFDATRSNCPWQSDDDFAGAGYQLFHRSPRLCPMSGRGRRQANPVSIPMVQGRSCNGIFDLKQLFGDNPLRRRNDGFV